MHNAMHAAALLIWSIPMNVNAKSAAGSPNGPQPDEIPENERTGDEKAPSEQSDGGGKHGQPS
jgi:hypothetical protein